MSPLVRIILAILLIATVLLLGPWLFVWAINTMIIWSGLVPGLPIGSSALTGPIIFNFWTWLAAVILGGFGYMSKSRR